MPFDEPVTIGAGALASADLLTIRNDLRWLAGYLTGGKPFARIRSSVSVALTNDGDWSDLTFDTVVFDGGESPMVDAGSLTAPTFGYYLCGACVRTEPTTANKALRIVGSTQGILVQHDNIGVSTPAFTTMNVTTLSLLAEGETLTAQVFQDSGGTINAVVEGVASPVLWATWIAFSD